MDDLIKKFLDTLNFNYWNLIRHTVENNKELKKTVPTFLLSPEKLIIYVGSQHIAIEYIGTYNRPISDEKQVECVLYDYSEVDNFLEEIIGVTYDKGTLTIPLNGCVDDLYIATVEATDLLSENNWNFLAQEMTFVLNVSGLFLGENFTRLRNCFFYEKNNDGLKVRNIKWMDIFPIERHDVDQDTEDITVTFPNLPLLAKGDIQYSLPEKLNFQYDKLMTMNRFIELYNSEGTSETDITRFLAEPENQFILNMAFFGSSLHAEKECKWIDNEEKPPIRPDFFVMGSDGMADILEFKLPTIKTETVVVGKINRETFSSEIHSYIAQTRVYREYFEDPRNRDFVKSHYGLEVYYPKRYLVVGRRWMFAPPEWRAIINEYKDLTIRTYDDIVDTVMGHLMS
ncbi:hypothetical protein QPK24_05830 [Paenibacillus polygoni]|uniref:PD-(D/E)XK nuclease superfamily protein n=1 Tax=Paenibacillus polygoni TaxID=3050112 RepID=A0ABY8X593_9BACL|nr:hypothetical protein [Paenibacillus polygoni]WIV20218.1 hypothetical protein QPK24_05830 [Paenibacillus polygoni]